MKAITEVTKQASKAGHVTVLFSDNSQREYKVQYTTAGRRYIKVYGKVVYAHRGDAI